MRGLIFVSGLSGAAADLDTVGWVIQFGHGPLSPGHRGLTHSLPVAILAAAVLTVFITVRRRDEYSLRLFAYLALVISSHGLLDAMTSYGRGVALLAPFSDVRIRAPWTPFSGLLAEMLLLWVPALLFIRLNIGGCRSPLGEAPSRDQQRR
jgi:membrane-bound metal-dependent hydrolase YbcI (DUF457 family)